MSTARRVLSILSNWQATATTDNSSDCEPLINKSAAISTLRLPWTPINRSHYLGGCSASQTRACGLHSSRSVIRKCHIILATTAANVHQFFVALSYAILQHNFVIVPVKWYDHIDVITSKAAKRLWFLKKLKQAGVSVSYYQTVVRPVLEYACPVWHSSLSKQQIKLLEDVQRRALQIIVSNIPYAEACCMLSIQSLADRQSELCRTLFKQIVNNEFNSLHYLLPAKRDTQLICWPRSTMVYPTFRARTNWFKNSFLP